MHNTTREEESSLLVPSLFCSFCWGSQQSISWMMIQPLFRRKTQQGLPPSLINRILH